MFRRLLSNFGDSNWWLGENSLFGKGVQTIADTGIVSQFGGVNVTQASNTNNGMESEMLKYGGLALLVYLVVKK